MASPEKLHRTLQIAKDVLEKLNENNCTQDANILPRKGHIAHRYHHFRFGSFSVRKGLWKQIKCSPSIGYRRRRNLERLKVVDSLRSHKLVEFHGRTDTEILKVFKDNVILHKQAKWNFSIMSGSALKFKSTNKKVPSQKAVSNISNYPNETDQAALAYGSRWCVGRTHGAVFVPTHDIVKGNIIHSKHLATRQYVQHRLPS